MNQNDLFSYSKEQAEKFALKWLPAWTGNNPKNLISFYTDDAFYLDPARPKGIRGRQEIFEYFKKLLSKYPDWIWSQTGSIPMKNGFVNLWDLQLPEKPNVVVQGCCLVQLRDGLIFDNRVFFDSRLML